MLQIYMLIYDVCKWLCQFAVAKVQKREWKENLNIKLNVFNMSNSSEIRQSVDEIEATAT